MTGRVDDRLWRYTVDFRRMTCKGFHPGGQGCARACHGNEDVHAVVGSDRNRGRLIKRTDVDSQVNRPALKVSASLVPHLAQKCTSTCLPLPCEGKA